MKLRYKVAIGVLALFMSFNGICSDVPSTLFTPEIKTLRYGCIEIPPYCYLDASGKAYGTFVDLANQIAQQAGYQVDTIVVPTKRALRMVASGDVDIWIGLDSIAVYKNDVYVSARAVSAFELDIYSKQPLSAFETLQDLKQKHVAVIRGYTYGGLINELRKIDNQINFFIASDHLHALNALYQRDVDYMIGYRASVTHALKMLNEPAPYWQSLNSLPVFLMVPKQAPNAKTLLQQLEAAYTTLYPPQTPSN